MASLQNASSSLHFVLFPFMSKGHIIPLIQLARLLLRRGITVTIFTTPANSPFISQTLVDTQATVLELPFPENIAGIPPGVESTDKLPSMSLFVPFVSATKLIQPAFDQALATLLPSVTCLISDGFLPWTLDSANKLGVPRLVFFGMNNYATAVNRVVLRDRLLVDLDSDDQPFTVPTFPWIKLTRNDFDPPFNDPNPKGPHFDLVVESAISTMKSKGTLVNSFYELEPVFSDYVNRHWEPKAWCVGPLCLAEPPRDEKTTNKWIRQWLDEKLANGKSVLYVAFGSQVDLTADQLREIETGLERSKVDFLWVVRASSFVSEGFEERMKGRGLVVREWVNQVEILKHESVKGFMSHCGWNSVMESVCAGVAVVAWPMMAEQHLNARMVVDELGIGVRVVGESGSVRGFMGWREIEMKVRELMEGEMGKEARKKVKELAELAIKSMEEGVGSSWRTLDKLIQQISGNNV